MREGRQQRATNKQIKKLPKGEEMGMRMLLLGQREIRNG